MNYTPAPIKNIIFALCYEILLLTAVSFVGLLVATPFVFLFKNTPTLVSCAVGLITLMSWYLYLVGTWKKGQTLPMKTWRLVIKTHTGDRPTLKHLQFRFLWAVFFVILIPAIAYLSLRHIGYAPKLSAQLALIWLILPYGWLLIGEKKQTLYDFLSGTRLMKKED